MRKRSEGKGSGVGGSLGSSAEVPDGIEQHTPGPWGLNPHDGSVIAANPYGHGEMKIADVRGWGHLTGGGACAMPERKAAAIQDANAALIAVAPEIWAALSQLREKAERLEEALRFLDPRNATERYERIAEDFFRETGLMAPGKDSASAAHQTHEQAVRARSEWSPFCNRWHEAFFDRALAGGEH